MFNLIPKPIKVNLLSAKFVINENTAISGDAMFETAIAFLKGYIKSSIGKSLNRTESNGDIQFCKDINIAQEGYIINCVSGKMIITVSTNAGAMYAVQTLRIHFNMDLSKGVTELSAGTILIEDAPRYQWRSIMLDESRHFWGKAEVKRILDLMLLHKLNVFHWHLTDDTGWRVEIKKYPLLTEIGSKRKDTQINGWSRTDLEGKPYEGYYTQDDIREIVAYAAERAITVVPEIDMPAHFAAAMSAYNWLACREIPCEVLYYFGGKIPESLGIKDWNRTACAGKETTYQFINDVIDELCELFPAPYFHIGGDEAPKDEWKTCPKCQETMRTNNLKNEEELQGYFNNRIYEHLKSKGKKMIGWNEVLYAGNLDRDVICQYWVPGVNKPALEHIKSGGKAVLSKHESFYFDMCYSQYPLKNTYKFDYKSLGIPSSCEKNILGLEGAVWTEWIGNRKKLDVTLFPRMAALAESAWSSDEKKNFDDFIVRLDSFNRILAANGVWYAENEVCNPRGLFRRSKDIKTWYAKDQNIDVKYNEIAKSKFDK